MQAKREYILAGLVSIISFVVYLKSLAPSVFWWDSGEFIANAAVLGIPHRPGFPLYILLARIFSFFGAGNISWYVNLFSAVAASLSLFFVYLVFVRITTDRYTSKSNKLFTELVGLGVVLILGFNYSFWIQAVRAEVYSLAFLLFSMQLWLVIKNETGVKWSQKTQFLFFFITGLSLTNHPAIALSTLPALLYLHMTKTSQPWKPANLFFSFLLFMLGISVYWYLPIRSSQEPFLNWLNPSDWSVYLSAIFAKDTIGQIQHFNQSLILQNLFGIIKLFIQELGVLSVLLAVLGFWSLGPRKRRWLWLSLVLILFNWLAIAFLTDQFIADNPDLHGYLLPSLFVFCVAFGWGCYFLLNRTFLFFSQKAFGPALKYAVASLGIIFVMFISAIPWFQSRETCNLAANPLPETYARQAVSDLKDGALVIIDNPNLDFLLRGLQYGENFRKDLIVIDRALLPARWYCDQLRHNYPGVFESVPANLTGEKLAMTLAMQSLNQTLPVYWEFSDRDSALSPYLLPAGYLCQIVKNAGEFIEPWQKQIEWESQHLNWDTTFAFKFDGDAQRVWSLVMFNLGCYYESAGLLAQAKDKYNKILTLSPEEDIVSARLKTVEEALLRAQN